VSGKLRVAIAGTGFGAKYAVGLHAHPEVEIVGVFSRRAERAQAMAEEFGIPFWTRDFQDLVQLPQLDVVAVVTPNSTHAEYVRTALRAGKHVVCDKPLALNREEGERLLREAEERGLKHVTFVPYRFSPASLAMKQAIQEGRLGRIIGMRATWAVDMKAEPLRWRFQRKLSGPGVVADLGAHIFDLMLWWAGPVRRALGKCRTFVPERPAEAGGRMRPVDVPDECYALLEFAEAGVGSANLSWNAKRDQRIEVEGERGALIYESPSLLQWLSGRGAFAPRVTFVSPSPSGRTSELDLPRKESFSTPERALADMFADIVSYLRGEEKPDQVATFADGLSALEVVDAVVSSDTGGAWVEVPPQAAEESPPSSP